MKDKAVPQSAAPGVGPQALLSGSLLSTEENR